MMDDWCWSGMAEAMSRLDPDFGRLVPPKRRITKRKDDKMQKTTKSADQVTLYRQTVKVRTQTSDGREYKHYPNEIIVHLNDEQLAHMRHHFSWLGRDDYVGYFLIMSEVHKRPYVGPLTKAVKRAVGRSKRPPTRRRATKPRAIKRQKRRVARV